MPLIFSKIWNWLKIAGTWLKGNWLLLVISAGIVFGILFAKNKTDVIQQLLKEYEGQQRRNAEELNALRNIQKEHIQKQEEISRKYNEVLDLIQKNYQDQLRTLDVQKEQQLRQIIETNNNNPEAMATSINNLFGIPIYPSTNT